MSLQHGPRKALMDLPVALAGRSCKCSLPRIACCEEADIGGPRDLDSTFRRSTQKPMPCRSLEDLLQVICPHRSQCTCRVARHPPQSPGQPHRSHVTHREGKTSPALREFLPPLFKLHGGKNEASPHQCWESVVGNSNFQCLRVLKFCFDRS